MPRVVWPLLHNRPMVEVVLTRVSDGQPVLRQLLVDTGAGTRVDPEELVLLESDCVMFGGRAGKSVQMSGAYKATFPIYLLRVQLPGLLFDADLEVIGVPNVPDGFDGIASFPFINRFGYGNFGHPTQFGLETP